MTLTSALYPGARTPRSPNPYRRAGSPGIFPNTHPKGGLSLARPVARPVGEHERGDAGVADRPAVGTPVGEPEGGVGVQDHLPHVVEAAVAVAEKGEHEQLAAVTFEHEVVHDLLLGPTLAAGNG